MRASLAWPARLYSHVIRVRFIDSVQGRMQSFVLKSPRSKTTATACSNLAPRGVDVTFKRGYARLQDQR